MPKGYKKNQYGTATNLGAFVRAVGSAVHASEVLGVGHSSVSRYMAEDKCPAALEKLAGYMLAEREGGTRSQPKHTLMMVRVPDDKREMLQVFLKGMEVQYSQFTMET